MRLSYNHYAQTSDGNKLTSVLGNQTSCLNEQLKQTCLRETLFKRAPLFPVR